MCVRNVRYPPALKQDTVTAFSVQGSSGGSSWWQKSVVFEAGQPCAAFFMFEELRPEVAGRDCPGSKLILIHGAVRRLLSGPVNNPDDMRAREYKVYPVQEAFT